MNGTWTPLTGFAGYLVHLSKKVGWISLCWVVIYFLSQPMREGIPMLFGILVGSAAGLVIGWWLAEDAVERAGFTGMTLWVLLVVACWLPMWGVEGVMYLATKLIRGEGLSLGFGRWMLLTGAMVVLMAATVWRASADD